MNIYVLVIEHKHGQNMYVHRTSEGADAALLGYVQENWENEAAGIDEAPTMPEDAAEAISLYFSEAIAGYRESYVLDCIKLGD